MKIYNSNKWSFRNNTKRKQGKGGKHPSLVVGEKDGKIGNFGLTHSSKRGHHKNLKLSRNPNSNDPKDSYLRDDLRFDDIENLKEILNYRKLPKKDIEAIMKIINKKR